MFLLVLMVAIQSFLPLPQPVVVAVDMLALLVFQAVQAVVVVVTHQAVLLHQVRAIMAVLAVL
jgi:hypothetical protein